MAAVTFPAGTRLRLAATPLAPRFDRRRKQTFRAPWKPRALLGWRDSITVGGPHRIEFAVEWPDGMKARKFGHHSNLRDADRAGCNHRGARDYTDAGWILCEHCRARVACDGCGAANATGCACG